MRPTFAGKAAALVVDVAAASPLESDGRVLGPTSGGAAVALAVGGGVASTVDVGGAPTVPVVRGVTGELRGRALEVLAGEGNVGRERVPVAPGSVIFGNTGDHGERARACTLVSARIVGTGLSVARGDTVSHSERVRRSDFDWGCGHGSTDSERAHVQLDSAVEAWRAAQDSVTRSVSSKGSANLDVVASAGSSLLRACAGSDESFTSAAGSARIAPHILCNSNNLDTNPSLYIYVYRGSSLTSIFSVFLQRSQMADSRQRAESKTLQVGPCACAC